jgi:hypothetical protein
VSIGSCGSKALAQIGYRMRFHMSAKPPKRR